MRVTLIATAWFVGAASAMAQPMDPSMPGMAMPEASADHEPAPQAPTHSGGHDMHGMHGMAMPMPDTSSTSEPMTSMGSPSDEHQHSNGEAAGGPPPLASPPTPPPPVPTDHAADRTFDPQVMAAARTQLRREHGGGAFSMVMANLAEYQARSGGGYRWEGEAWYGSDLNRLVVKSEGEGARRGGLEAAEAQVLYSRAVGPYFDLQAGVRQDFKPTPRRTYAALGVEGLLPYWFEVQGALFLSTKGDLLARAEGTYDLRITQRLVLQPRAELNFAAQDVREVGLGSGLTNAELGLRLRYEIRREFAPYIGISYDRRLGRTADLARAAGEDLGGASFVAGIRAWF